MEKCASFINDLERAKQENDTSSCLAALRRLMALEPHNPKWKEEFAEFEARRLAELREMADKAIAAEELRVMEALIKELDTQFSTPRAIILRADITTALHNEYSRQTLELARTALANMATSYAAHDFLRADAFERQYQEARASPYFKPSADVLLQFDEAYHWIEQHRKTRTEAQRIEVMIATLRAELDRRPPSRNLKATWQALCVTGAAVEPALTRRVTKTLALLRKNRMRRIRISAIFALPAIVILSTGIISIVYNHKTDRQRQKWILDLDQAINSTNLQFFDATINSIQTAHPEVLHFKEFQQRLSARTDLEQSIREQRNALRQNMDRLDLLLAPGTIHSSPGQALELMAAVERDLQAAGSEDLARFNKLLPLIEQLASQPEQSDDKQLAENLKQLDELLNRIETMVPLSAIRAEAMLSEAKIQAANARNFNNASQNLQQQAIYAEARAAAIAQTLQSRRKLKLAIESTTSIPAYIGALQVYANAFPKDAISREMNLIAARETAYKDLLALESDFAIGADFHLTNLQQLAEKMLPDTMFWQPTVQLVATREKILDSKWPDARQTILALAQMPELTDLFLFEDTRASPNGGRSTIKGYLKGRLQRENTDSSATAATFIGTVYIPQPSDTSPLFRSFRFSADSNGQIPVKLEPMPQCGFFKDLAREAGEIEACNADVMLALKIDELASLVQASALMRARMIEKMIAIMQYIIPSQLPDAWDKAQRDLAALDHTMSWLCAGNPDVVKANAEAATVLKQHFSTDRIGRQYAMDAMIQKAGISRGIYWAGYASFDDPPKPILITDKLPPEIWILTGAPGDNLQIAVAVDGVGEKTQHEWPFEHGTLLFAPNDGRTTMECKRLIMDASHMKLPPTPTTWPPAWPINKR